MILLASENGPTSELRGDLQIDELPFRESSMVFEESPGAFVVRVRLISLCAERKPFLHLLATCPKHDLDETNAVEVSWPQRTGRVGPYL
jgi:hypothetical protein